MASQTKRQTLKVLISTGHLGTAPSSRESFMLGMAAKPDYVVADGGSTDGTVARAAALADALTVLATILSGGRSARWSSRRRAPPTAGGHRPPMPT